MRRADREAAEALWSRIVTPEEIAPPDSDEATVLYFSVPASDGLAWVKLLRSKISIDCGVK